MHEAIHGRERDTYMHEVIFIFMDVYIMYLDRHACGMHVDMFSCKQKSMNVYVCYMNVYI